LILLTGWDGAVAQWVGERLGIEDFGQYKAIGVVDDQTLIAGVVYNNLRHPNIEMTIASESPRWCSRRILFGLFAYPFNQLRCQRVTAVTERKNQPTRAFLYRLGFREEGQMRRAFPSGEDAVIHGMLREECRWLEESRQNVQRRNKRASRA
jgi:RimJ/RimL family protein N-acetyltransferase